jgi:hypothetical protein
VASFFFMRLLIQSRNPNKLIGAIVPWQVDGSKGSITQKPMERKSHGKLDLLDRFLSFLFLFTSMAGRIIAQLIVQGIAVVSKAAVSAYSQALRSK